MRELWGIKKEEKLISGGDTPRGIHKTGVGGYGLDIELCHLGHQVGDKGFPIVGIPLPTLQINCGLVL